MKSSSRIKKQRAQRPHAGDYDEIITEERKMKDRYINSQSLYETINISSITRYCESNSSEIDDSTIQNNSKNNSSMLQEEQIDAQQDTNNGEAKQQSADLTDTVLTPNEELLNGYDHEAPPKVAEEQKTKEEEKLTIEETSEITNNNDGRDGAKPEEQEIAGDYIEDNEMKGDQDIVDKADDHKDEQPLNNTHHSDIGNSNFESTDQEFLRILDEVRTSFKNTTRQKINGQENCEDGDEQDSEKNEDKINNEFNVHRIDGKENCEEGYPNEEEKEVKNEFDPETNSTERLEEVQNAETNSRENKVDQVHLINIEENKNSCETQRELNNKALITQICDSFDSSVTNKIELVNQALESLKSEIITNNEKIDNNITIMNKKNEILNGNSNSLSSLSSSIKAIQNLISKLPQSTTIDLQFSIINHSLTTLNSILTEKDDQNIIQSKFESQECQINKIREEFKTEYKQLLDTKDTEIKNLNQQLKEQKTETENYRQILDKQTVEYERDKQRLEQHKVTIEENKRLLERQKKEINDCLKRAEDAVCKQSILQSKLDDQTKRHKQELKTKADELNETVKRQKEELIKKTDELKEEAKKLKEELNMTIMNLEDKLKGQTSIVDKARGEIKSMEDFIRELIKDKDNQKEDIKDLNKKLDQDEKKIKDLENKLIKLGEKNNELNVKIECKEQEHNKILDKQIDETNRIKNQLDKNLKKLEKLKQKYYNQKAMVISDLRDDIQELSAMKQISNLLVNKLDLLLNHMTEFDSIKDFKLIDSLFDCIIRLEESKNDEELDKDAPKENYQKIVDFLFKLKDKFPYSNQEQQDGFDVFDKIMDFITEHSLMPSKILLKKYKSSETNSQLEIPDYKTLNDYIGMEKEEYELLIENTKDKEEFVYFFDNSNIKIDEQIENAKGGNKCLVISHCSKNSRKKIGAGLMIYSNGEIYQGYFKANKMHFFGRTILTDSECYTGRYINNKRKESKKLKIKA